VADLCRTVIPGVDGHQENLVPSINGVPAPTGNWLTNHRLREPNPICILGLSPLGISTLLTKILTTHFSAPELIMQPSLKQYQWAPDATQSKMRIVPATKFDPAVAGMLPAVVVKRGNYDSQRNVIGDQSEDIDLLWAQQGRIPYCRFMQGQHSLFCIAETDGEAEDLGIEVFETLTYLGPELVRSFPFHNFETVGLSELGVIEEMGNRVGVSVAVKYVYELAWTLVPLAPPVKTLSIDTTTSP
jgi:hypothetical protein